jgi:hypothetical protein
MNNNYIYKKIDRKSRTILLSINRKMEPINIIIFNVSIDKPIIDFIDIYPL